LVAIALPVRAEMYKWVDENGVTNYSSTPPAAMKKAKATVIEDRVSVIQSDTSWKEAAAMSAARPDYATEEWLQRQRLMALKDSYTNVVSPYPDNYYYPGYAYAYPGYAVYPGRPARPVARAAVFRAAVTTPRAAPRGSLMR
jgi:hypothetical protein